MERDAFARAWRFLSYDPVAKWSALAAAVGTGVLYVALLVVLGLFADLVVNRGQVPAYRELTPTAQEQFRQRWDQAGNDKKEQLLDLGLSPALAGDLAARSSDQLPFADQALVWRGHVVGLLRRRVGPTAAALVLPFYRDLPAAAQAAFQGQWQTTVDKEALLRDFGFEPAQATALAARDPAQATPEEREWLWRAHLYQVMNERFSPDAAYAWYSRFGPSSGTEPATDTPNANLADRGVLSLVVRSEHSLYGPALGGVARFNPWMWRRGDAHRSTAFVYLTGLLLLAVVLALGRSLLSFASTYLAARATVQATTRLRRAVYHHTYRLGTLAFHARGPSEAVGVFTRHLEAVHDGLYAWLTVAFREPIKFVLILAFALLVNFWLALAFLLFALLVWLVGGQLAARFRRQGRVALNRAAEQLVLIQESLMLMRLVKAYLMELFNQARVERQLARYARAQLRRYRGEALARPLLVFLGTLAALVLLYVSGLVLLTGQLNVATGITLATALVSLYWPLLTWLENRRFLRRGRASAVVLFRFLDRPGGVGQVVGAEFLPPLSQQLAFDGVSLKEPGTGRMLLHHVHLTIQAGQRVAFVGPDEMEKHALVYLIVRFLDPSTGAIRIDGKDLRWVTLDSLRAQTALVLQHNLVFNDTVANNIGCGDAGFTLPQIIEASKVAHAHQFIQKLPQGYETVIGEMGQTLTVGQQFLIALARAILRDPALLIIEEPAEGLDDDTKALLDDTFARVLPGRTALFLPHRLSTIRSCDRIYLIHKGRVEAAGGHRELLSENELYRHLHYLQFNELVEQIGT